MHTCISDHWRFSCEDDPWDIPLIDLTIVLKKEDLCGTSEAVDGAGDRGGSSVCSPSCESLDVSSLLDPDSSFSDGRRESSRWSAFGASASASRFKKPAWYSVDDTMQSGEGLLVLGSRSGRHGSDATRLLTHGTTNEFGCCGASGSCSSA